MRHQCAFSNYSDHSFLNTTANIEIQTNRLHLNTGKLNTHLLQCRHSTPPLSQQNFAARRQIKQILHGVYTPPSTALRRRAPRRTAKSEPTTTVRGSFQEWGPGRLPRTRRAASPKAAAFRPGPGRARASASLPEPATARRRRQKGTVPTCGTLIPPPFDATTATQTRISRQGRSRWPPPRPPTGPTSSTSSERP